MARDKDEEAIPQDRLVAVARNLRLVADSVNSARTMTQVVEAIQMVQLIEQALFGIAYNFQKKQLRAMSEDLDPTQTGFRVIRP